MSSPHAFALPNLDQLLAKLSEHAEGAKKDGDAAMYDMVKNTVNAVARSQAAAAEAQVLSTFLTTM